MKVKFKGMRGHRSSTPADLRGRTYDLGTLTAGVSLTEDGLTLLVTNRDMAEKLEKILNGHTEYKQEVEHGKD